MFSIPKDDFINIIENEYPLKKPNIIITKTLYDLYNFVEIKKKCSIINICIIGKDKTHVSEHILGFTWFTDCYNFAMNYTNDCVYIITDVFLKYRNNFKDDIIYVEFLKIYKHDKNLKIAKNIIDIFDKYSEIQ